MRYVVPHLPLKTHGGKSDLAQRIIDLMVPHLVYCEPFAGGLAVLLNRDPRDPRFLWPHPCSDGRRADGVSEVVSDLNGDLMGYFRTLREPRRRRRLNRRLRLTPLSEKEWNAVRNAMTAREAMADAGTDPVERAAHFYVWSRQSRSGLRGDFTGITKTRLRGGRNGDVNAWRNAVEDLDAVAERLLDVVMLDRPAVDVIRSQDGPATEFYLDPTYYPGTRTSPDAYGEYEMTEADHHDLLTVLAGIRGRFLLSGYAHPVYDDFAARQGWYCVCRDVPNHAAGGKVKQRMLECVWLNYPPPASALTWWSVRVWAGRPGTFDVVIRAESSRSHQ